MHTSERSGSDHSASKKYVASARPGRRAFLSSIVAIAAVVAMGGVAKADAFSKGLANYKPYVVEHFGVALAGAKDMQRAIKAGDLKAAQAEWIKARKGWEAVEPVTGTYFGDLDKLIDAWPDAKQGFHAIEAVLFRAGTVDGLDQPAADLVANLEATVARAKAPAFSIGAQKLLEGTANLAYEVGEEKSKGGESPFAGTSIVDMRENVEGIEVAYKLVFAERLKKKNAKLAGIIGDRIEKLEALVKVDDIKSMDQKKVHVAGEELAALLLQAAPALGLKPFKVGDE